MRYIYYSQFGRGGNADPKPSSDGGHRLSVSEEMAMMLAFTAGAPHLKSLLVQGLPLLSLPALLAQSDRNS